MKLSANESLLRTDCEMVCAKNFFGFFTPGGSSQSSSYDAILTKNRMKLTANKSLHCTDFEMVCDRKIFGCFTTGGSPQSSSYNVTANCDITNCDVKANCDVKSRTSRIFLGSKEAEKISVSYHF